jgi:hypothetical protein
MHLAGEADAGNIVRAGVSPLESLGYRYPAGTPPVFGMLLGPPDLRRSKCRVLLRGRAHDAAFLIENQSARPAGSNINP